MESSNDTKIILLKKELAKAIERNHFNLISPDVLELSIELDILLIPLFQNQLNVLFP